MSEQRDAHWGHDRVNIEIYFGAMIEGIGDVRGGWDRVNW